MIADCRKTSRFLAKHQATDGYLHADSGNTLPSQALAGRFHSAIICVPWLHMFVVACKIMPGLNFPRIDEVQAAPFTAQAPVVPLPASEFEPPRERHGHVPSFSAWPLFQIAARQRRVDDCNVETLLQPEILAYNCARLYIYMPSYCSTHRIMHQPSAIIDGGIQDVAIVAN